MAWLNNTTERSNGTAGDLCDGQQEGVTIWLCVAVVSFALGFPGACFVLFDYCQKWRKGIHFTPNDVLMLNIVLMDGIFLTFLLLQVNIPLSDVLYYKIFSFSSSFNLCGRPLLITSVTLDCYLAVVHPVTYRATKRLTPRVLTAVAVWIVTTTYGYFIAMKKDLSELILVIFFAFTLPVIAFCDFSILWTLKRSNPGGGEVHPLKKKALQIVLSNLAVAVFSYLPPAVSLSVSFLRNFDVNTAFCSVVAPVLCLTCLGNTTSILLHLKTLRKLDWLKCWKQK